MCAPTSSLSSPFLIKKWSGLHVCRAQLVKNCGNHVSATTASLGKREEGNLIYPCLGLLALRECHLLRLVCLEGDQHSDTGNTIT